MIKTRNAEYYADHVKYSPRDRIVLLRRPFPKQDECWAGYLLRIANSNFINGINAMASCINTTASALLSGQFINSLNRLGIQLPSEIISTIVSAPKRAKNLCSSKIFPQTRFCPICIKEDKIPYLRARWGFVLMTACAEHQIMLVTHCSSCNAPFRIMRKQLLNCDCGQSFFEMPGRPIEEVAIQLPLIFREAVPTFSNVIFANDHPLANRALSLICKLIIIATHDRIPKLHETLNFLNVEETIILGKIISDWPHNAKIAFTNHSRLVSNTSDSHRQVYFSAKDFASMELATQDFSLNKKNKVIDINSKYDEVISITQLTKITGYPRSMMFRFINSSLIPGTRFAVNSNRKSPTILNDAKEKIEHICRNTLDTEAAAFFIGCCVKTIIQLFSAKLIPYFFLFDSKTDNSSQILYARVEPAELRKFADKYFGLANEVHKKSMRGWVSLDDCGRSWTPKLAERNWTTLMESISNGVISIRALKPQPIKLSQLILRQNDVAQILKQPQSNDISYKAKAVPRRISLKLET